MMGMRCLLAGLGAAILLAATGCGKGEASPAKKPETPKADPYASWPKDTIPRSDGAGAVEFEAPRNPDDAEPLRVASRFMMPDWARETGPLMYASPKGARVEIHYMQRTESLRAAEDAKVEQMVKGIKEDGRQLVIARPWRGWYGEANSARSVNNKALPCRMRIYTLFQPDRQLELHVEWPKESPKALEEAQEMVAEVVSSITDLADDTEG